VTSCHVPQQFKPLVCVAPVVIVRMSSFPSPPVTSRNSSNRWSVSPRWLLCGWPASHHLLSRPATVQTAGLCHNGGYCESVRRPITFCQVPQQFKPLRCLPGGYCECVGPPITSCHASQQFKPLRCVVPVVSVKLAGVPSHPVTSRNSSNRWAVSLRLLL
jgi:hypothetical protein